MPLKARRIDSELESQPRAKARFIEPMLLLRAGALPEAAELLYELKLDGCRALAINGAGRVQFRSRNDNDFSVRYLRLSDGPRIGLEEWLPMSANIPDRAHHDCGTDRFSS
jgi:ATP-dependent DNA ligase